jgi:hypothetical protein
VTRDFFKTQINRLVTTYGDKAFSGPRIDLIWKVCHELSDDWFETLVNGFLLKSRNAPLPSEFIDAAVIAKEKNKTRSTRHGSCNKCSGYGSYIEVLNGLKYGFQCPCPAGKKLFPNLPKQQDFGYQPKWSPEEKEPKSVLSEDEKKELFTVIKQVASGAISKPNAKLYCEALDRRLRESGVIPDPWRQEFEGLKNE